MLHKSGGLSLRHYHDLQFRRFRCFTFRLLLPGETRRLKAQLCQLILLDAINVRLFNLRSHLNFLLIYAKLNFCN